MYFIVSYVEKNQYILHVSSKDPLMSMMCFEVLMPTDSKFFFKLSVLVLPSSMILLPLK